MQVTTSYPDSTTTKLTITADQAMLDETKKKVLATLAKQVKVPGFRPGKAPLNVVEKQVDQSTLQTEFLEEIVNRMYVDAAVQEKIRPVNRPDVAIKKFVPFTDLEVEATVETVGKIELPDYKKIKLTKSEVKVTAKDIDEVVASLRTRVAEKKDVKRAAKSGDQVWIDFAGRDAKTNEPIQGADGKDYPLVLGSNTFIPGFEDNLVGAKAGDEKEFTLTFPKDYGVKVLQNRKVTFKTTVTNVQEVVEPTVDDDFAAKVSPFKTLKELREDIKKQLTAEREQRATDDYQSELLAKIAEKSKVDIPPVLIEEELDRIEQNERQNLAYRGQTWQEHLDEEGVTEKEHREKNRAPAAERVKAGLVLSEIADKENIEVTDDELAVRLQLLHGQYQQDEAMQAELAKPENVRDIRSRMMTEKALAKLSGYAQK